MTAFPSLATNGTDAARPRNQVRAPRPRPDARPFDPRHPGRLASAHRRALVLVLDSFARLLATSLSGQLRSAVTVGVSSVEQRAYSAIIDACDDPTWIAVLSLGPMPGNGILELPLALSMAFVERLLGGTGAGPHPERGLTELESTLVGGLFTAGLADLGNSFAPLCAIEAGIARVEHQSELLKAAPPAEAFAVIGLEIGMPEVGAPAAIARLALPMSGLEPAFEAFSGAIKKQQVVTEPVSLVGHVLDSAVEVSLRFGPAPVPARELVALRPGQVIRLGQSSSASLSLEVESVPFLAARPGRVGRRLACVIVDPATEPGVTPS